MVTTIPAPDEQSGKAPSKRGKRWWIVILIILLILGAIFFIRGRTPKAPVAPQQGAAGARPVPVGVAAVKKGDMSVYINGLGSVSPFFTVTVKSRVDGQLMDVLFKEGQTVTKGQLIATIDPRPFEVQLSQAEGQLARDQALLQNARLDVERYRKLWQQDSVPKQQLDTQEALVRQYEAAIKTDQGLIDSAKLQLLYCRITSPITGRIGLRVVDPGNIVHAADPNGLVVITQVQPISVIFPIAEDSLPPVLSALKAGKRLTVDAFNRGQTQKLATGVLLTVDNQIDPTTGTVRLKATFENKDNALFPNQFINARLLIDVKKNAIIMPSVAIQRGPQGTFVYLVKPDSTVTVRPVAVGDVQGSEVTVVAGLSDGDSVVVDGAERLREGAKVDSRGREPNGNEPGGKNGQARASAEGAPQKNGNYHSEPKSGPDQQARIPEGADAVHPQVRAPLNGSRP
jgi:multidrug efflux system membrane fusion protein